MATIADDFKQQVLNTQFSQMIFGDIVDKPPAITNPSSGTFVRSRNPDPGLPSAYSMDSGTIKSGEPLSISSYTLSPDESQFSNEVELWIKGYSTTQNSPVQSTPMQSSPIHSSPGQVSSTASGQDQYNSEVDLDMWVRGNRGYPNSEVNGKQGSRTRSDYNYYNNEDRERDRWERGNRGYHVEGQGHGIMGSDFKSFNNEPEIRERRIKAIQANSSPRTTESAGVQPSRVAVVQRSTLAPTTSLESNGMWYLMAMILPLFSVNNCLQWRCTPSMVFNAAEIFLAQLSTFVHEIRDHIRRIARDQLARDLFATAMDIVLVVYALGFLVLSLYQASVLG